MENQHKKISGYRDLTQTEIDLINQIKGLAEAVGQLTDAMKLGQQTSGSNPSADLLWRYAQEGNAVNARWLAIGVTHLQQGFMAVTRAVAKPTTF